MKLSDTGDEGFLVSFAAVGEAAGQGDQRLFQRSTPAGGIEEGSTDAAATASDMTLAGALTRMSSS